MPFVPKRLAVVAALAVAMVWPSAAAAQPSPPASPQERPPALGGPLLWQPGVKHGGPANRPPPPVVAASFLVADARTGAVLASKEPHWRLRPASTLKTLTALALLPRLNPRQAYVATHADVAIDGSRVGMVENGRYRIHQLFEALFLASGNDAANGLANAAGGLAATARLMNETAAHLQAHDTVAVNPSGLDAPGQLTSAYDLALVARAGLARADFRRYASTVKARFPGGGKKPSFEIWTRNRFLARYPGAIGIKNGWTSKARHTLVAAATRGNRTLIVTVLGAKQQAWPAAAALMNWGFTVGARARAVGELVGLAPATETGSAAVAPGRPRPTAGAAAGASAGADEPRGPSAQAYVAGGVIAALALVGLGAAARAVRSRRRGPGAPEPETY